LTGRERDVKHSVIREPIFPEASFAVAEGETDAPVIARDFGRPAAHTMSACNAA